jgi:hypothetical protein
VARRVQEVEGEPLMLEARHRRADRNAALALERPQSERSLAPHSARRPSCPTAPVFRDLEPGYVLTGRICSSGIVSEVEVSE